MVESAPGPAPSFATVLRSLRERGGLTQEELAERAGLTRHAISALERGQRTRPYPHTVRSLADALELSAEDRATLSAAVPRRADATTAVADAPAPSPGLVLPPTRLLGREEDLDAMAALVHGGARLVTLTGPGGVGKTRLVGALTQRVAADFPDGTVTVPLAAVAEARAVLPTLARALNVSGADVGDALAPVVEHLKPRRMLVVLDNFEHVLSASADVGRLVGSCPGVTVLVTSRSPLRLRGEQEYAVPPLALPADDVHTLDELGSSPSGALLLDRAGTLLTTDTDDDAVALATLCRRLAGLPLAIELACTHLRVLSPRSLVERLHQVNDSLGARDLPERQRTMRATLDWSYALLNDDEQRLFRVLGGFRGGATLEAVEAVGTAVGLDTASVLPLLGHLVEHSLVTVADDRSGERRYGFLEPVAEYARSLLIGDEYAVTVAAHGRHFCALTEEAAQGYERADAVTWLARVDADEANVLLAISRSLDSSDPEAVAVGARITWAMWLFWWLRDQAGTGIARAERCLRHDLEPALLGRVHLTGATMSYAAGLVEQAAGHWAAAHEVGEQLQDFDVLCKATSGLGLAALSTGDLERAATQFTAGLEIGVRAGAAGVWLRSLTHVWLGTARLLQGDPHSAQQEIVQGLALSRERGDRLCIYVALYNLAQVALAVGDLPAARAHLHEGIELSEETEDLTNLTYFLEALAVVESAEGTPVEVAFLFGAAHGLRGRLGENVYAYYVPDQALISAAESSAREALGEEEYAAAYALGGELPLADVLSRALRSSSQPSNDGGV